MAKKWSELSGSQRRAIAFLGAVEAVLTTVAVIDLVRRPREQVRGSKVLWGLAIFVQPVGPVVYLLAGRRGLAEGS